ncbi:protocadherin-11 X-linked-like isoform X1 [Saccostrea cucullata]|uniref:protocadherin-11 X-linked-like isoform X1 n=1 Tax=Saccostrea cuccullata TaxID=36930 RepID=UPI002ED4CC48
MASILPSLVLVFFWISCCYCQSVAYITTEEVLPPVFLGNVADDSNLTSTTDPIILANVKYSFLSVGSNSANSDYFQIDENTGELKTKSKLDRETICPFMKVCVLSLRIGANSGTFFRTINVNVSIIDRNDNSPLFPMNSTSLSIPEDTAINATFPLPTALDRDMGENNSLKTYVLEPPSSAFGLLLSRKIDESLEVNLVLNKKLDREKLRSYRIYLVAKDGGLPQRSSTMTINIAVADINDNKPRFSYSQYNVTIQEDIAVGTNIIKVSASDDDSGPNGIVEYRFSSNPNGESQKLFSINNSTGEVKVIQQLTFTSGEPHRIVVSALDHGSPPLSSQAFINIHVVDVNNHAPEININLLSGGKVSESSNRGTVIAYVAVVDKDTGKNGQVKCTIDHPKFQLHNLSNTEYKVIVSNELDREENIEYIVKVYCEDEGVPKQNKSESFIVQVLDRNDNEPKFDRELYNATITENKDPGQMITKVTASDSDQGSNAEVRYSIEQNFRTKFDVDSSTGIIRAKVRFDREVESSILFKVYAADNGSPVPLTATATVKLNIEDDNDEYPTFNQSSYEFQVMENRDADFVLGTVAATDEDIGSNAAIVYTIPFTYQNTPFSINPSTGEIKTNRRLDREVTSRYVLSVMATDRGVSPKNTSCTVTVTILDENDEYPQIKFPTRGNESVKVPHTTIPNSVVTRVEAYDKDEGENGSLKYSIVKRDDDNLFYIDSKSGQIYLSRKIESFDIKEFSLFIDVSDQGKVPLKTGVEVRLFVEYHAIPTVAEQKIGQNVLIAITIACVTIVLSLAIIVTIFLIRRMDNNKRKRFTNVESSNQHEFQLPDSVQYNSKKSCLTRENSHKTYLTDNNNLTSQEVKKVSFSSDDQQDSGIFMIGRDVGPNNFVTTNQHIYANQHHSPYNSQPEDTPPPRPRREKKPSDLHQEELNRMASINFHHKLIKNYNKPLMYHPDENRHYLSQQKPGVEDSISDGSGEVTVSDSGRGGSMEDVHRASVQI